MSKIKLDLTSHTERAALAAKLTAEAQSKAAEAVESHTRAIAELRTGVARETRALDIELERIHEERATAIAARVLSKLAAPVTAFLNEPNRAAANAIAEAWNEANAMAVDQLGVELGGHLVLCAIGAPFLKGKPGLIVPLTDDLYGGSTLDELAGRAAAAMVAGPIRVVAAIEALESALADAAVRAPSQSDPDRVAYYELKRTAATTAILHQRRAAFVAAEQARVALANRQAPQVVSGTRLL